MKIKITNENADKLVLSLENINGRAASMTITNSEELEKLADRAEKQLASIPKAKRKGAKLTFTPNGPPNAYKYAAKSTKVELSRGSDAWFLTHVSTVHIFPRQREQFCLTISEHQADIIKAKALLGLTVARA